MTETVQGAILSDRFDTPIGPMVLLARDGILLLLEFAAASDRLEREIRARFGGSALVPTADPFGLTSRIKAYFAGDLAAIDGAGGDRHAAVRVVRLRV